MFAVPSDVRIPVVALKLIEDPDVTLTDAGTVRAALSLPIANVIPPLGTGFDNETVQELLPFDPKLDGIHATEVTLTGATKPMLVLADEPL